MLGTDVKEKYHRLLKILIIITVFSSGFYYFSFMTADTDLWGHIKFGEDLWVTKTLPHLDPYSFTAQQKRWINHEWLTELFMFFIYSRFGSAGLLIGKLLVGFAILAFLTRISLSRSNHYLIYVIIHLLGIGVMSPSFMTRPQLVTLLLLTAYLYIFHLYLERGVNGLWLLPLIMVFWVNSHGGFVVGAGMFFIVVCSEGMSSFLKKSDQRRIRVLFIWMIVTNISTLVNPYGHDIWFFLIQSLRISRHIGEWKPVGLFDASFIQFKLMAILFLVSLFMKRREKRLWEVGILVVSLVYAFKHQRHTAIFGILAVPYLVENWTLILKKADMGRLIKSVGAYRLLVGFFFSIIVYQMSVTGNKYLRTGFNIVVDPKHYPIYAVHFLKENRLKGNILLPFEWGEYVIWKLYPDCKVSIDGRFRTAYPEHVLNDHIYATVDETVWRRLLDHYPADILLARRNRFSLNLMKAPGDWVYVYSDGISLLFIKKNDQNHAALQRFRQGSFIYPRRKLSVFFP
jgi:hypothetical protein